jgi:hypothetical protein
MFSKGPLSLILVLLSWTTLALSLASAQPLKCPSRMIPQCSGELPHLNCFCTPNPTPYVVTGTVTGLAGTGLTLSVGSQFAANPVTIGIYENGPTSFYVAPGTYTISIGGLPRNPAQACVLTNATGTAGPSGSTPFTLNCGAGYSVGGTISGLAPGSWNVLAGNLVLTLQTPNTAGCNVYPTAPGTFTFSGPLIADGQSYDVAVQSQPWGQTCTVANGTGTIHGEQERGGKLWRRSAL